MKEKQEGSVSRTAEQRRESDWEKNRKPESTVKAVNSKPSEHFTRADQHATVKSAGPQGPNAGDVIQSEPGIENPDQAGNGRAKSVDEARAETEGNFKKLRKVSSSNR